MMKRHTSHTATFATKLVISLSIIPSLLISHIGNANASCAPPPTPVRNLSLVRYYTDKAGTKIDLDLKHQNERATQPLKQFVTRIGTLADEAVRYNDLSAAQCALSWLQTWATAHAYLGNMKSKQAEYQRKWDLAGTSLAYLKLQKFATPQAREKIEPWLKAWAKKSLAFLDDPRRKRNNHWYWLGLGVTAVALATNDDKLWSKGHAIFLDAMHDIRPDGSLPLERARASRALHYHTFAATPLVAMAELARARNQDWYQGEGRALHKLVALMVNTHINSDAQATLTDNHVKQAATKPGYGWLPIYLTRFPVRFNTTPWGVKRSHRWLGGDVRVLQQTINQFQESTAK